ncbi:MAG: hypothetical protein JO015_20710 [Verrucomicrobia bacterium]|nr:hypothetical protein [Verrucomicrobiota bacterium]
MKNLFVSPERVAVQNYRTGLPFRVAAAIILAGLVLQAPMLLSSVLTWRRYQRAQDRREMLRAETANFQAQLVPLQETKRKLQQIHQWEPIFKARLPVSAILAAVEKSIPDQAVLGSVSIEADQFDRVPVTGGVYRVPTNYRLVLQGETRPEQGEAVQVFSETLLRRLPPGSEEIRNDRQPRAAGNYNSFVLQYSIKPNGNYFGMGVQRLADPDPL